MVRPSEAQGAGALLFRPAREMHRVGRLEIGETSLLVAVSSGHRKEAFDACHYAVDRIKQIVPVWKKEVFEGGEEWVEGHVPDP